MTKKYTIFIYYSINTFMLINRVHLVGQTRFLKSPVNEVDIFTSKMNAQEVGFLVQN